MLLWEACMTRHLRTLSVLTALLCAPVAANAQSVVSYSANNSLPHDCYVSALTLVKTGSRLALDGIRTCDAALNSALNQKDRAATYDNRGILHQASKAYAAAWDDFDASIRLNPELGDAWLNRGAALLQMRKPDDALTDIQHGVSLGPSLPQIGYFDLGVAHQTLGHIPEAYAAYKQALAADPDFTPASEALKNFRVVSAGG